MDMSIVITYMNVELYQWYPGIMILEPSTQSHWTLYVLQSSRTRQVRSYDTLMLTSTSVSVYLLGPGGG